MFAIYLLQSDRSSISKMSEMMQKQGRISGSPFNLSHYVISWGTGSACLWIPISNSRWNRRYELNLHSWPRMLALTLGEHCDIQNMADVTHEASLQFEFINCLRELGSYCGTVTHFWSFCKNLTAYVRDSSPQKWKSLISTYFHGFPNPCDFLMRN